MTGEVAGGDPFTAFAIAVVLVVAAVLAAAGVLCVTVSAAARRRRARDMEAIVDATREQHPRFADWDTRELAP